jgi:hypothetical protein
VARQSRCICSLPMSLQTNQHRVDLRPDKRGPSRAAVVALVAAVCFSVTLSTVARAQTPAAPSPSSSSDASDEGWTFAVYPILAWVPTNIDVDLNLPPSEGGGINLPIDDSQLDGAFLAGFAASKGPVRLEADFMWAAFGGDRVELPRYSVDVDVIYGHGTVGVRIVPDLYITGGVRRIALKYDVSIPDRQPFTRKPGVWDPVVGLAWHRVRPRFELHAQSEYGGFGVGADYEFSAGGRVDWKFARHFGLIGGYGYLRFKVSDDVGDKELVATQTLHGPVAALGIYF